MSASSSSQQVVPSWGHHVAELRWQRILQREDTASPPARAAAQARHLALVKPIADSTGMPNELWLSIMELLSYEDLKCFALTNRAMQELAATRTPRLDAICYRGKPNKQALLTRQAEYESPPIPKLPPGASVQDSLAALTMFCQSDRLRAGIRQHGSPVYLHPVADAWLKEQYIMKTWETDDATFHGPGGQPYRFRELGSELQQNATDTPCFEIQIVIWTQVWETRLIMPRARERSKVRRTIRGVGSAAITVEQLVRGFFEALKEVNKRYGGSFAYGGLVETTRFKGWMNTRVDENGVFHLWGPEWAQ